VAGAIGGHFIGAPSRGGGRPACNHKRHQSLRFPIVDCCFRSQVSNRNQFHFFPSLLQFHLSAISQVTWSGARGGAGQHDAESMGVGQCDAR
jgi:hypothetical protein